MIFKRMNYKKLFPNKLAKGKYKTYEYEIWNRSGVPAAYIKLPIDISSNVDLKTALELGLLVHGGITFTGSLNYCEDHDVEDLSDYWIGWDYSHAGDYMNLPGVKLAGKKWSTRKIYKEVKSAIRQIIDLKLKNSIVTTETDIWRAKVYEVMKKSSILEALEVLYKRIEDVKQTSEKDPYVDAYVLSTKLIKELNDILKTTSGALVDVQLHHWIERQQYAVQETGIKNQLQDDINSLDSILEKESNRQMTIDDFLDNKDGIKEVEIPACKNHEGNCKRKMKLKWLCPVCGQPRGQIKKVKSYDGSLWMVCDGWDNPCGHVDEYDNLFIEAMNNGLNKKKSLIAYITCERTRKDT